MKILWLALLLTFATNCSLANKKKYRPLNVFTPKKLRKVKPNSKLLLHSNGESPFLKGVYHNRPEHITTHEHRDPFGLTSRVRISRRKRPQLLDNNFGTNHRAPRRVPRKKVIKPLTSSPPNPHKTEPRPEAIVQFSRKKRNQIAQNFFVRANYTANGLFEAEALIRLMQRNYGLEQTGLLDDETISFMMAPRCGFPDAPANFQTFPGNPRWQHNPVTYKYDYIANRRY